MQATILRTTVVSFHRESLKPVHAGIFSDGFDSNKIACTYHCQYKLMQWFYARNYKRPVYYTRI